MVRHNRLQGLVMLVAAVAFLGAAATPSAHATEYTWNHTGTPTYWSNVANWGGSGSPSSASDIADFTSTGIGTPTVTVTGAVTVGTINISAGGYNITNTGTKVLTANNIWLSGASTITGTISSYLSGGTSLNVGVDGASTLTISGKVSGSVGLTKTGLGTLILGGGTAANNYSGTTTINGGTLKFGAATAIPSGDAITINSGATLDLAGYADSVQATITLNSGTIADSSAGKTSAIDMNNGSSSIVATGNSLIAAMLNEHGARTVSVTNATDVLTISGAMGNSAGSSATKWTLTGLGTLILSNTANNWTGGLIVNGGTVQNGASNVIPDDAGGVTVTAGTWDLHAFQESIATLKSGAGVIDLNGGTLNIVAVEASVTPAESIISSNNGAQSTLIFANDSSHTLNLSGNLSFTGSIITSTTGTLTLSGTNAASIFTVGAGTTLNLQGNNTGATNLNINGGTFTQNGSNQLDPGVQVSMTSGTYNLNTSHTQTITSLSGAGGTVTGSGSSALTVNQASSTVFSGQIASSMSLVKTGGGTLTLSGANTYTGATNIQAGTLQAGALNVISTASAVTVSGTFDLNNYNQSVGSVAGAGSITLGTGTLTAGSDGTSTEFDGTIAGLGGIVKMGAGIWSLTNAGNAYSGDTSVTNGVLRMTSVALPSASALNLAGGTFESAGGMTISRSLGVSGPGSIRWTAPTALSASNGQMIVNISNGPITWDGSNGFLASGQALTFGAATSNSDVTLTSDLNLAGAIQTVTVNSGLGGDSATLSGHLTAGGLTKNGLGVLVLTNPLNDYAMGTNVSVGTLRLGAVNVLPGNVTVSAGATLDVGANDQHNLGAVNLAGGTILGSGTLYASGSYTVTSGTINVNLAGAGGLQVLGNTVVLNGTNTYAGDTVISGGTLKLGAGATINNSAMINVLTSDAVFDVSAAAPYAILPGQTLRGHGSVIGDLVIQGKVAPGDSPGTITVTGNVEYGSGSELDIELAGVSSYSQLVSTGTVTLDPGSTLSVTWTGIGDPNGDIFDVVQGQTVSGAFGTVNLTGAPAGETLVVQTIGTPGSGQVVELQVIPEPATLVLLGFGLAGVVGLRRRNRKA